MTAPAVRDDAANHRYEITVDGQPAGHSNYRDDGPRRIFTHTRVLDGFEGRGLGGQLVRAALDDVRARGLQVVARCPFVAQWIEHHPDYADLLAR